MPQHKRGEAVSAIVNVAAVVTTFKPEGSILANLKRIATQVGLVILVDDTGQAAGGLGGDFSKINNLLYIKNKANIGIAATLNAGVERAAEEGFNWVIALDDDTLVSETYIADVFEFIHGNQLPDIGLVACSRGVGVRAASRNEEKFFTKRTLITSGSVFSVDVFRRVDGFDEGLFIDLVDFDFCTKIRKTGRSIVMLNKYGMDHRVGNSQMKNFAFLRFVIYNHAPFRLYYQMRNIFIFVKKHFTFDPMLSTYIFFDAFRLPLKALLFEREKLKRLSYLAAGLWDGLIGRRGAFALTRNRDV